jgi:DNA polymerase-1
MAGRGAQSRPVVAFVGSAPRREDDRRGEPFRDEAGEMLQQAVEQYNLGPAFYTTAVRCFPGSNARGKDLPPSAGQVAACKPYLETELTAVNPKWVVAVGNHALRALTGKSGITTWAGQIAGEWHGAKVFAMLHPSYILQSPAQLPRFEAHAKALSALMRPAEVRSHPQVRECTPGEAKGILLGAGNTPIAFDYETTGLSPWEGHRIRCFAFSDGARGYWVNVEDNPRAVDLLKWFLQSKVPKIAQNLVFESVWSLAEFGIMPKNLLHDPLLYAHLIDEDGPKALDLLAGKYLGAPGWDIAPLMRARGWVTSNGDLDYSAVPIRELGAYNGLDAVYTARLVDPLRQALPARCLPAYETILLPLAKLCARMEFRGMHVDRDWAERARLKYTGQMSALLAELMGTPEVKKLAKKLPEGREVNFRSPQQMVTLFYDILKIPCRALWKTDSGGRSAKAEYLEKVTDPPKTLVSYLAWKERETVCGKYLDKFPGFCDTDNVIHASHNPARIVTGRVAVADPPLQNVPEGVVTDGKTDGLVRGMFNSRFPGGKLISSDYKALEFRLVCSEAEETDFIRAFIGGLDPHALTATDLFGKNFTPDERDKAKVTNFSLIYGVTEYSLAPKLGVSQEEAARLIVMFKKKHPKIFVWMERQYERVRKDKIAVSRFGRIRHLPDITGLDKWRVEEVLRQAGNFPIQSAGADITNLAIVEVDQKLRMMGMQSKVVLNHHDSIMVDTHPDEVRETEGLLVKVMQEEIPGRLDWLRVPLQVDIKIVEHWGGATWQKTESGLGTGGRSISATTKASVST